MPQMKGFTFLEFDAITTEVMRTINPEVVLSPLVCDDFDATQMIAELARYNFKGRYRAVTSGLTNPQMVLREVRTFAPAVDFDLLVIPEDGSLSIMQ